MGRLISLVIGSGCLVWSSLALGQQNWDTDGNNPPANHFLGTTAMAAFPDLTFKVNNQRSLVIDYTYDGAIGDVPANIIGGHWNNAVADGVFGAVISGGGSYEAYSWLPNVVNDRYGVVVGGGDNRAGDGAGSATDAQYAAVVGGLANTANAAYSFVGGGQGNFANSSHAAVAGGNGNYAGGTYAAVGGGRNNSTGGSGYGVVAGGWSNEASNLATVPGGYDNTASANYSTVGGGYVNLASGTAAVVSGGAANQATSPYGAVLGGYSNTATTSSYATVGGGYSNDASGQAATIPGGYDNTASGAFSFAAGRRARASGQGCFVWADSTNADLSCPVNNLAILRSSNGIVWYTNAAMTTGVSVSPGSGTWNSISDEAVKRDIEAIDPELVLELVGSLPITMWRYESEDPSIRHLGPMAQDFYAAFALGDSERHISVVDADGVALAAIQALQAENQRLRADVDRLLSLHEAAPERVAAGPDPGSRLSWFAVLGSCGVAAGVVVGRRRKGVGRP